MSASARCGAAAADANKRKRPDSDVGSYESHSDGGDSQQRRRGEVHVQRSKASDRRQRRRRVTAGSDDEDDSADTAAAGVSGSGDLTAAVRSNLIDLRDTSDAFAAEEACPRLSIRGVAMPPVREAAAEAVGTEAVAEVPVPGALAKSMVGNATVPSSAAVVADAASSSPVPATVDGAAALLLHSAAADEMRAARTHSTATQQGGAVAETEGPALAGADGALVEPGAAQRPLRPSAAADVVTSLAAGAAAGAAFAAQTAPPADVNFKIGTADRYLDWPLSWADIKEQRVGGLLTMLSSHRLFAGFFEGVKSIGDCTVFVVKPSAVPAGAAEPDSTHETGDNVVELTRGRSLGSIAEEVGAAGTSLYVHVRLPVAVGAARAFSSAGTPAALLEWLGLLVPKLSVDDVYATAASVAASAVRDSSLSVEDEARMWGAPAATRSILRKALPFDTSNKDKRTVMMELVDPVGASDTVAALHERVWLKLQPSLAFNAQRTSAVLLTGVSGAGKTKTAFDIGSEYAFVVMTRVIEQGIMTDAWQLLEAVTEKLRAQSTRRSGSSAGSSPSAAENNSAVGALLVLLSCQMEWAIAVYEAAVKADAALVTSSEGKRVLRQAVLRAQRNGIGNRAVKALFASRLREVLADATNVSADGWVTVPIDVGMARLSHLNSKLPAMPVVWCYDEVQVLLDAFSNFFQGTYDSSAPAGAAAGTASATLRAAPALRSAAATASDVSSAAASAAAVTAADTFAATSSAAAAAATDDRDGVSFYALPDDVAACDAASRGSGSRGWFYSLLVAMRNMINTFTWGHVLCGSSLRLNRELLLAHSPAQGVCDSMDADVRLNAATIRAWYEQYLTPAAAAGLDDRLIERLAGRPLYASFFFLQLCGMLNSPLPDQAPQAVVATALKQAVATATSQAQERVRAQWGASFPTRCGEQPQALLSWLYYLQRMGWGTTTAITPPSMSSEVMDAVQCGVLHVGRNAKLIDLADEPITADAILTVGDMRTSTAGDCVMRALARRVTGAFGDSSAKGATAEDAVAWTLLRRARNRPGITLRNLLAPFLGASTELVPSELDDLTVTLRSGLHCDIALGAEAAHRTFLELLAAPGGSGLLLHHTQQKAASADIVFLAQRSGELVDGVPRQRLVLLQLKNAADTTASQMLPTVDLGCWYPDQKKQVRAADGTQTTISEETRSHAAFRALMADHPDWCDPVRVLVSARPWSSAACETAAWINYHYVPEQPLVLAQITKAHLGVDILQGLAGDKEVHVPDSASAWWPTPIRHWPDGAAHPQPLLRPPVTPAEVRPSRRVIFTGDSAEELEAAAAAAGRFDVVRQAKRELVVRYVRITSAFCAVATALVAAASAGAAGAAASAGAAGGQTARFE